MKNDKDCLILIPGENHISEPDWSKLILGEDISIEDHDTEGNRRTLGKMIDTGDAERCLKLCVLQSMGIKLSGSDSNDNSKKDALVLTSALRDIKGYIDRSNPNILSKGRNILCAHFSAPLGYMRKLLDETWEHDQDLKWFINPFMGRGAMIIASYTLGGTPDKTTRILKDLKSLIERGQATLESIHPDICDLFDYLWRKAKVPRLTELIRNFFMIWQFDGNCGGQDKLLGTLREILGTLREILEDKDSYLLQAPDIELIDKLVDAGNKVLDFSKEEKQGVFDLLDRLIEVSM